MSLLQRLTLLPVVAVSLCAQGLPPSKPVPTLRSSLLEQLRTTHDQKDWFVPANLAVEGLTAKQASWSDGSGNHSVGQLTNHLVFWNRRQLAKFKGEAPSKYDGNNEETFNSFDAANWSAAVHQLNEVMLELEKLVQSMPGDKLQNFASDIGHIATHNAYHVGQILYVRKLQGSWDAARGVK
jgi:hypothetical protein